ncbi:MAG TPA: hypothetical protein VFF29_07855 [Bacteroidota bacterium]|nr:hypothetical protein [Bacteroidota bacterium]
MKEIDFIVNNKAEFFKYLKSKFKLIHLSNVFFRDFHYGVMSYLQDHGMKLKYLDAERKAHDIGIAFEKQGIFKRIDHQSWVLIYPDFALPRIEKKVSQ